MSKVFVAGHKGMVGSAICRLLRKDGRFDVLTVSRKKLDLLSQNSVHNFIKREKPDIVIQAAAKVGGIYANNTFPAQFIYENLQIQNNIIHGSHLANVQRLLFLGSSCIYPKLANQPLSEDILMSGKLEQTNEPYALAKIAGIKLCESYNRQYGCDFRSIMPTNLYGPGDNFHPENSHVLPALLRRFHEAKKKGDSEVTVWGSGKPKREFLHVDDLAEASLFIMNLSSDEFKINTTPMQSHINVGSGKEVTIRELAEKIMKLVGFNGKIIFDTSRPDGTLRKLMNVDLINRLGWHHKINLNEGLNQTYDWLLKNESALLYTS